MAAFAWNEWQASSGISGNLGLECANKANIPWRVLYSTSILLGIQAAIEAGLGISALAINTALSILTTNDLHQRLPELGKVTIGFITIMPPWPQLLPGCWII